MIVINLRYRGYSREISGVFYSFSNFKGFSSAPKNEFQGFLKISRFMNPVFPVEHKKCNYMSVLSTLIKHFFSQKKEVKTPDANFSKGYCFNALPLLTRPFVCC